MVKRKSNRNRTQHLPRLRLLGAAIASVLVGGGLHTEIASAASSPLFPAVLELSSLDGSNGFKINGEAVRDFSGVSVSDAGDVNGDGIDDLIIGAHNFFGSPGASYVIFGSNTSFSSPLELSSLNGNNGFKINGEAVRDYSGFSVSGAGDINGDGIADLIVGAPFAEPNGLISGASYVVFGSNAGFESPMELSGLNGSNGFKLNGDGAYDQAGMSVSAAGDFNDDGIDDLIIGARRGNNDGAGTSYVVFGKTTGFASALELSSLDGSNGIKINGEPPEDIIANQDFAGYSVSGAGDVNGDGIDDVVIGMFRGFQDQTITKSYVVFGSDSGFYVTITVIQPGQQQWLCGYWRDSRWQVWSQSQWCRRHQW